MLRRKHRSYKFTEKTHSKKAIVSVGLSAVSELIYLIFVFLSYKGAGRLSAYFGGFGVLAMIISVAALIMAITTLKEEDSFPLYPMVAMIMSVVATLCWVGTYIIGFVRG